MNSDFVVLIFWGIIYSVAYLSSILLHAELKKEIPSSFLNKYSQILVTNPIHISTALSFLELNTCYSLPECQISSAQIEKIYSSILSNKNISKTNRAIVSAYYGDYFQLNNNLENALQFMQLAQENKPKEIQYKIRTINILLLMKRFDQAKAIIDKIEKKALNEIQ
ncbi:MAG: hypothetical protein KZQ70_14045 [gamma proteobacterium symbiont of Lucinoma myriamae]|nr:hypothetical protein [gamma proteobacterium symbiont of Lucinoma myriamae]